MKQAVNVFGSSYKGFILTDDIVGGNEYLSRYIFSFHLPVSFLCGDDEESAEYVSGERKEMLLWVILRNL